MSGWRFEPACRSTRKSAKATIVSSVYRLIVTAVGHVIRCKDLIILDGEQRLACASATVAVPSARASWTSENVDRIALTDPPSVADFSPETLEAETKHASQLALL